MPAGPAQGGVPFNQAMADRNPLVEHKALPAEPAVALGHGFEISEDSPFEVKHFLEALAQQIARRLFATDPAGTEHGDLAVALWIEVFGHIGLELGKVLRPRIAGLGERAQPHFIIVARIHQHHIVAGNEAVPVLGLHIGAHFPCRIGFGRPQGHDLWLEPHLHAQKRHFARARELDLGALQPLAQHGSIHEPRCKLVDRFGQSCHRAVDPLWRQDQRALDGAGAAELGQNRLNERGIGQVGKLIDCHNLVWQRGLGQIGGHRRRSL